jgi:hypothetical protein
MDVEYCCVTIAATANILCHHFIRIPSLNLEIHPIVFRFGTHHTLGTQGGAHVVHVRRMCESCVDQLIEQSFHLPTLTTYYPLIHCEHGAKFMMGDPGFMSIQTMLVTFIIVTTISSVFNPRNIAFALMLLVVLIMYNNLGPFNVKKTSCKHVRTIQRNAHVYSSRQSS